MNVMSHILCRVAMVLVLVGACSAAASAQGPQGPPPPRPPQGRPGNQVEGSLPSNPGEVGKLFDAYAVVQAQEQLGLDEEQFGRFVPRFTALLEVRRRQSQARMRLLNQLGRLVRDAPTDEAALREQLRALDDHDASSEIEVRKASDAATALLTPVQLARFRVFEAQMERRKVDLMMRARQGNRRNQRQP